MICPTCQTDNRHSARFCDNCGTPLQTTCSNCETENRPGAKFCDNCGHSLAGRPEPARQPAAAATETPIHELLIPPELANKLRSARRSGHMKGERRVVTMLFCDLVGSTAASEKLDPEEWAEIMNDAFEYMISPVYRYEGTVARLMGDAVLAFFGAPMAHEDDPRRAVLAGLEIIDGIRTYRERVRAEWSTDLDARVGINTGLVVVGGIGSDLRMEYTAMGDAINLAARMEQTARPGTVQIAEATYRQVSPFFDFEALGGLRVKGKTEPVPSYRVLGIKAAPGTLRGIEGLDAPLIGRQAERAILQEILTDLQHGHGGIVCLVGEAGLGKSRLIEELKSGIRNPKLKSRDLEPLKLRDLEPLKLRDLEPLKLRDLEPLKSRDLEPLKSRDLEPFKLRDLEPLKPAGLEPSAIRWYETASLSYETGQPYGLFQRLFRRVLEAGPEATADELRHKIGRLVGEVTVTEPDELRRALESLFGLPDAEGRPPLKGETFKGQLFQVMSEYWRGLAGVSPVVLVCDDLHWTDPASAALLQHLFSLTEQSTTLILCAMRPDAGMPGWGARNYAQERYGHRYREIALQPLASDESDRLVDSLLGISDLPDKLRIRIQEKTAGNPFFVEEVVRFFIEAGMVVPGNGEGARWTGGESDDFDIPGNVQALLMARIDRLDEAAQQTLQLASVIGRSFYYRVLARISEMARVLDQQLLTLQQAKLIRLASQTPELEYIFRHALTQEAAYQTILLRQRREFHRQVGEALEALFPGRTEEMAGALAHHFLQAWEYDRALLYYTKAGDGAFRLHAPAEAIEHYGQAIACLQEVEATSQQLAHLYGRLGRAYELYNKFEQALEIYREMMDMAAERGDKALKLASLTAQCILMATQTPLHDIEQARQLGQEAVTLALELDDRATEARVLWVLLLIEVWGAGDDQKALAYGLRSLELARQEESEEQVGYTLTNLTNVYQNLDRFAEASETNREAQSIWRGLDNKPMLADSLTMMQWLKMFEGKYREALAAGDEAFRVSQSVGNLWNQASAQIANARMYSELGEFGLAIQAVEAGRKPAEEAGLDTFEHGVSRDLLEVYLRLGATDEAERLSQALARGIEDTVPMFRALYVTVLVDLEIARGLPGQAEEIVANDFSGLDVSRSPILDVVHLVPAKARLDLAMGRPENARPALEQLIHRYRPTTVRMEMTETMYLYGRVLAALNETQAAREILLEAHALAAEMEMRWDHWQILVALAEIDEQSGYPDAAASWRGQAREVVDYIAVHIGRDDLRSSFLGRPEIRGLAARRR